MSSHALSLLGLSRLVGALCPGTMFLSVPWGLEALAQATLEGGVIIRVRNEFLCICEREEIIILRDPSVPALWLALYENCFL